MAGHMINQYLKESTNWEIIGWNREEFEIKENNPDWKDKLLKFSKFTKIDYIINCIGILKPVANANPALAMKINAVFPHELVEVANKISAKVIHITTDCWNDLDIYGRSKRAGEFDYPDHLTLRTTIIGPELKNNGSGLFHWFMMQKKEANGFINHFWDGITTLELAKTIKSLIEDGKQVNNVKDLRNKSKVNKFELISYLNSAFEKNICIHSKETEVVDKTNAHSDIFSTIPIEIQIKELKLWMEEHKQNYAQYFSEEH